MRKRNGPTRKERREEAEKLLLALLRTPKTRAGLIAAAQTKGVTQNFVYGWLSLAQRDGTVTMLKSVNPVQYQVTSSVVIEKPAESLWPTWLEPRSLPDARGRRVFIDGRPVAHLSQGAAA